MSYSRAAWHSKPEVNTAVERFYHRHARQPDSTEAKQKLLHYLDIIRSYLEGQGVPCQGFQYVGSTYEGLKVDNGLEFDVFVILDGHGFDVLPTQAPDYHLMRPRLNVNRQYMRSCMDRGYVSAESIVRQFQGYMDALHASNYEMRRGEVVFRKHGPAIQMDVSRYGSFWFSVDLVPTYAVGGNFYVAKPHGQGQERAAWLHSFSVEMKQKLDGMDADNGRRKQILRTLKALCYQQSTLKPVSSHHLKMLLFSDIKSDPSKSWRPDQLAVRLLDLIKRLQEYYENGHFPHFFLPQNNMIGRLPDITRRNIADRLENLYNSEIAFMRAMDMGC